MNELHAILDNWRKAKDENQDAVLATVVHVTGSAYRRPGARMLMLPDGTRVGSISGGCLEGDVSQKAWWLTEDNKPALRVYDTMSEEDIVWEVSTLHESVANCGTVVYLDGEEVGEAAGY